MRPVDYMVMAKSLSMKNFHLLNQLQLSQKKIPISRNWSGELARSVFSDENDLNLL